MTNEVAKNWLNKLYIEADITDENGDMVDMQPYSEAVDMAIKALEQQPCEDAISRQAAIDAMATWDWQELYLPIHFKQLLEELPPVSTEKTGRWIRWYEVIESADGKSTDHIPHCKCSECDCEYDTYSSQFIKYCSNCGAKMGKRGA